MKTINIGVIGCGSIAKHRYLPEYDQNEYANVVVVCDRSTRFTEK